MSTIELDQMMLIPRTDLSWGLAACAGSPDPEMWFPDAAQPYDAAAQVCAQCPIRAACRAYGVATRRTGVWGGVALERGKERKPRTS